MPAHFLQQAELVLHKCQRSFAASQHRRRSQGLWQSIKAALFSASSLQGDEDATQLRQLLEARGYVVWAMVARAHVHAFGAECDDDHWGSVVYFTDPDAPLDELITVSDEVRMLRNGDMELEVDPQFIDWIRDDSDAQGANQSVEVPERIAGYHVAMFTPILLERDRLPQGFVRRRLIPVVIAPQLGHAAVVLDPKHWPDELRELWRGDSYQLLREEGTAQHYEIAANLNAMIALETALLSGAEGDLLIATLHEVAGLVMESTPEEIDAMLERVAALATATDDLEQRGELCRFLSSFIYQGGHSSTGNEIIVSHARELALPLARLVPVRLDESEGFDEEREALRTIQMLEEAPCSPRVLLESFKALVLCAVGDRKVLKDLMRDVLLVDAVGKLSHYFDVLEPLAELSGALFDEQIVALHVPTRTGFLLHVDNIVSNFKLHELLLETLSRDLEGASFATAQHRTVESDGDEPMMLIESPLNLWNWTALKRSGRLPEEQEAARESWIWNEGAPRDIPRFHGELIVLLGPAPYARAWNMTHYYDDVGEPRMQILKKLSQAEVERRIALIVNDGKMLRN